MDSAAVEIDGSVMEGGGQILRVSAALSCITGSAIKITKIRAGRSTPGLRWQNKHGCTCYSWNTLCFFLKKDAIFTVVDGNNVLTRFNKNLIYPFNLLLVKQIKNVIWQKHPLTSRFLPQVFKPIVEKFGVRFDCDIKMRGYYPKGGGEVMVTVNPVKELQPVTMTDRGNITKIHGRAFVAGVLPYKLAKDMSAAAVRTIRKEIKELYINIQPVQEKDKAYGNGNGIIIIAESSTGCLFAGSALGKKGVYADKIGIEAAEMLLRNIRHNGCVDEFLQDQLIIFMALAKGTSRIRTGAVTLHTQTAIHIAEQLTQAKFTITKSEDELSSNVTYIIECQGSGVVNPHL
uniref:RNA 3'-terminal phosphate cyclase n=1 Tax=Cyprinodon variegatus TaxID=28743 RepID=A0A3Q2DHB5_CYPVA